MTDQLKSRVAQSTGPTSEQYAQHQRKQQRWRVKARGKLSPAHQRARRAGAHRKAMQVCGKRASLLEWYLTVTDDDFRSYSE